MKVEGDAAHKCDAVRKDSYRTVNLGVLMEADEDTGKVKWKDKLGQEQEVVFGPHEIVIVRRSPYGRS